MKNFKKVIALGSAVMMSLTMSVSAFAATADYENGFVKLTGIDEVINSENQWTVVVIDAANQNEELTAEDLYYINQGSLENDAFWTDGLGTKVELTDGDYIVRIGGETLTQVVEIPLTISTTPAGPTYMLGDVTKDELINMGDAAAILNHFMGDALITDEAAALAADVTLDDIINMGDAAAILNHFMGDALIVQPE